jgi:methylisocitrate lyase
MTEELPANEIASLGFAAVAYPWTLAAAHIKGVRDALDGLKSSFLTGRPPMILSYEDVVDGVGFNKYWVSLT